MKAITAEVWAELDAVATALGVPPERVGTLRRRLNRNDARPGAPYLLLAGRPHGGLDLVIARWFGPKVAERLRDRNAAPLVVGPQPAALVPRLSTWSEHEQRLGMAGHVLAWCAVGESSRVLVELGALGYIDQLVLVTRLGQPLNQQEVELAGSLAALCATARVLVVTLPGEDMEGHAAVVARASSKLRQAGFDGGRYLGAEIWLVSPSGSDGTKHDLGGHLALDTAAVEAGRGAMAERAVRMLLADLCRAAESQPATRQAPLDAADLDRILGDLANYLRSLGGQLEASVAADPAPTLEQVRARALDLLRGWRAHNTIEGFWLKHVNNLCPGFEESFIQEAESALALLDCSPAATATANRRAADESPWAAYAITEAKRLLLGFAAGLAVYLGLPYLFADASDPLLAPLRYVGLAIFAVLGYGVGRRLFAGRPPVAARTAPAAAPVLVGWDQVQARLVDWAGERLRAVGTSSAEQCRRLAQRLGIELEYG